MLLRSGQTLCRRTICSTSSCPSQFDPDHRPEFTSLAHIDEKFKSIPKENHMFKQKNKHERGHVEFITSALKHMKEYKLHNDLDTYKALMDIFPRGPFRSVTFAQKMFFHYPHQQECAIKLMDEMEWNHVYPDKELHDMVCDIFGPWTMSGRKAKRQLYWLPKLRYTNKYLDVREVENKNLSFAELAKIALQMICRDPGTEFALTSTPDRRLIVSGQSPLQRSLISSLPKDRTCFYVDGPFDVYVRHTRTQYVVLNSDPVGTVHTLGDRFKQHRDLENIDQTTLYKGVLDEFYEEPDEPTIHEQPDMTILALAVMEQTDQNSASVWVNYLQDTNPALKEATVILRVKRDGTQTDQQTQSKATST